MVPSTMPNLDDSVILVNNDLLALLRNAYFEGFIDRGHTSLDESRVQEAWVKSLAYGNFADTISVSDHEPPHHRLDPSREQLRESDVMETSATKCTGFSEKLTEAARRSREDEARFNEGHKPQ